LPFGNPGTAFTDSSGKPTATQTVSPVTRSHELLRSAETSSLPVCGLSAFADDQTVTNDDLRQHLSRLQARDRKRFHLRPPQRIASCSLRRKPGAKSASAFAAAALLFFVNKTAFAGLPFFCAFGYDNQRSVAAFAADPLALFRFETLGQASRQSQPLG
jgi:hypothetical protein